MRDPGLQPERTALAWQRTGLAATMIGALGAVASARTGSVLLVALCSAAAALAAVGAGFSATREQSPLQEVLPSPWVRLVITAVAVCGVALGGLALAVVG